MGPQLHSKGLTNWNLNMSQKDRVNLCNHRWPGVGLTVTMYVTNTGTNSVKWQDWHWQRVELTVEKSGTNIGIGWD